MPFTPSHAVVALPFARTPLPAGAVAVGAMAPDLPLFFPWVADYHVTHGFPSLLWVSLPLALVLYGIWRLAIRPAASGLLLPAALRSRIPAAWDRPARPERPAVDGLLIVVAALIGVASHVAWDLFTHPGRLGSLWIPALAAEWGPLPGTAWLQHGSSAFGLAVLAAWAVVALRRAPVAPRADPRGVVAVRVVAWVAAVGLLVGAFTVTWLREGIPSTYRELADTSFDAGTGAGAAILVLAVVAAIAVRLARAAVTRAAP